MNIKFKNRFLYLDKYKIKCAIGKRGITSNKKEGDYRTPRGSFILNSIFYRKDRVGKIKTKLKKVIIKQNMGWCDDATSKQYNKLIRFPFNYSAERLWLKANIYDVIIIINYNLKPIRKNKGSAIFIHIARKNYKSTKGCIAINKREIKSLINKINNKTKLIID